MTMNITKKDRKTIIANWGDYIDMNATYTKQSLLDAMDYPMDNYFESDDYENTYIIEDINGELLAFVVDDDDNVIELYID